MNQRAQQRVNAVFRLPVIRHAVAMNLWLGQRWRIAGPIVLGLVIAEVWLLPRL